jgi:hypothetical protein
LDTLSHLQICDAQNRRKNAEISIMVCAVRDGKALRTDEKKTWRSVATRLTRMGFSARRQDVTRTTTA